VRSFFDNSSMVSIPLPEEIQVPTQESIQELLRSHPIDWEGLVGRVAALDMLYLIAVVVVGVALLLAGYKIYKVALVLSGIVAGTIIGVTFGRAFQINPMITGAIFAVALGILAIPLQKILFFVAGGAIGVIFVSPALAMVFGERLWLLWLAIGFVALGALAVLFFKQIVIIATSLEGAILVAFGTILLVQERTVGTVRKTLLAPDIYLLILVCLLTLFGVVIQAALEQKKPPPPAPAKPE